MNDCMAACTLCAARGDDAYTRCTGYAHYSDEQLSHLVASALLRADPSKVRFVNRFESGWQASRPALLRLAHLFQVPVAAVVPAEALRDPSPERDWVRLDA